MQGFFGAYQAVAEYTSSSRVDSFELAEEHLSQIHFTKPSRN
jgi:hypothetical protein